MNKPAKRRAGRLINGVKSIGEFFSDVVDAFKDTSFVQAIEKALPWAGMVGGAAAEVLPPLKFFTKIAEELTKETDPEKLGLTACTIAFQRATEKAFSEVGSPMEEKRAIAEAKKQIDLVQDEDIDISTFSIKTPHQHEFFDQALLHLQTIAFQVGYTRSQVDRITTLVQENFQNCVITLLASQERFAPFKAYLDMGGGEERQARKFLGAYVNYQRWLYEEAPVLGRSPFALKHIYIETDCSKFTWGEIKSSPQQRSDLFGEQQGPSHPLLETVLDLIESEDLKEAIVIQGVAGAGKSSFTLRLCDELLKRRLTPVRVRIKNLSFDTHLKDALPKALLFEQEDYPESAPSHVKDPFLDYNILDERGTGGYEHLCRYVFIFDGWDEISLSNEGFKKKVAQMLEQINSHFLAQNKQRNKPRVRVILTGRPTSDIGDTNNLREDTPILTIRRLRPEQLRVFVGKIAEAVNAEKPLVSVDDADGWKVPSLDRFEPLFKKYEEFFKQSKSESSGELDALGLPLLAYLTVRLVSEWPGDPAQLVDNTTTLYRNLIDLTCRKAGKAEFDKDESDEHKIYGSELRSLLHQTAAAITIYGQENIPRKELAGRLGLDDLDAHVDRVTAEQKLSSLLISFYFKGGHENLGCEFAHKSFREYLFAEAIVETLKDHGRKQQKTLPPHEHYYHWQDFDQNDAGDYRYEISRNLSEMLAPHWLTPEVQRHLQSLIEWEIERTVQPEKAIKVGTPTESMDWRGWKQARTGLADMWEWWGEGVHLRPQIVKDRRTRKTETLPPYVYDLILTAAPLDPDATWTGHFSTTIMDAHLGEGLCLLCALVHAFMADNEQEAKLSDEITPRKYQSIQDSDGVERLLFKPSGGNPDYFRNYIARINSTVGSPRWEFPCNSFLRRANLRGTDFSQAFLIGVDIRDADLSQADLTRAIMLGSDFSHVDLRYTNLYGADISGVNLSGANLSYTSLSQADLSSTFLVGANFSGAKLLGSVLHGAIIEKAIIGYEQIASAEFDHLYLDGEHLDRESVLQRLREKESQSET